MGRLQEVAMLSLEFIHPHQVQPVVHQEYFTKDSHFGEGENKSLVIVRLGSVFESQEMRRINIEMFFFYLIFWVIPGNRHL